MKSKLVAYIKGEVTTLHGNTKNAMVKRGWLTEEGKVTDIGLDASGLPTITTTLLEIGTDVQIGKYILPKGLRLPLVWRNQDGKNRRNWYFVVALPIKGGDDAVELTLAYNSKHLVKVAKLPLDTVNKSVLYS
jgi:hypothetical protein